MTEDDIFLAEDGLSWCLAFLYSKERHFLEGGLENCSLPEVSSLPDLKLIDLRKQVNEFFDLIIDKVEGEEQAKKASDDKDIVLLLTFLEDCLDNPSAYLGIVGGLDDDLMLKSVLLNEDESNKSIEMMLTQVGLKGSDFIVDSFSIDLLAVPKQGYCACDLHESLVNCFMVWAFFFLLVGGEEAWRL